MFGWPWLAPASRARASHASRTILSERDSWRMFSLFSNNVCPFSPNVVIGALH